jgi:hypothetical protein
VANKTFKDYLREVCARVTATATEDDTILRQLDDMNPMQLVMLDAALEFQFNDDILMVLKAMWMAEIKPPEAARFIAAANQLAEKKHGAA